MRKKKAVILILEIDTPILFICIYDRFDRHATCLSVAKIQFVMRMKSHT